jgi:hypothetical protein
MNRWLITALLFLCTLLPLHAAKTRGLSIVAKDPATGNPTGEVKLYNKAWAVFIGIDRYQEIEIPRLKNAVNDARGVKRVLEQRFKFDEYRELSMVSAARLAVAGGAGGCRLSGRFLPQTGTYCG